LKTLRAGLLGRPVAQSLSPRLHQAAGAALGVSVDYRLRDVTVDEVDRAMDAWRAEGLDGFNITAPHKAAAARWVDRLDPMAARVGAVNTVVCKGTETIGFNTDVRAFAESIGNAPDRVVILGAGGAIRAVVVALLDQGVSQIEVVNRSQKRAKALADDLAPALIKTYPLESADDRIANAELVINGLPAAANEWVIDRFFGEMAPMGRVVDLGYGARVDRLKSAVTRVDRRFQDGLEMLARQGIASFKRWTGIKPPLDPVLSALLSTVLD